MSANVRAVQPGVAKQVPEIQSIVAAHATLSDVVAWLGSRGAAKSLVDVVAQDEYTHDVVVKFGGATWLVYDVT
jgi:hypothetical protein